MNLDTYLRSWDLQNEIDGPKKSDYKLLRSDMLSVLKQIRSELYPRAYLDAHIQDASFQDEIILEEIQYQNITHQSSLRFSNFGRMVAYTNELFEQKESHPKIVKILEDSKFIFIPNKLLDQNYDGVNSYAIQTWWDRFFDYL